MENKTQGIASLNMVERVCADKEQAFQKRGVLLWTLPNAFC